MLKKLESYYREQGILATHFTCHHRAKCREGYEQTFTGPKSAAVSTGYEDGRLPRLLFISLDSGSGERNREKRLPAAVRDGLQGGDVDAFPRNKHWFRTHELAWYILKEFDKKLAFEEVKHHFAHTNAAKCCQNKPKRQQADHILFQNCRRYLDDEIRVLLPDIIVTQGDWAKRGLKPIVDVQQWIDKIACIVRFDDRPLFWLRTYHPRFGGFFTQCGYDKGTKRCEGWQKYAGHVREFMDKTRRSGQ